MVEEVDEKELQPEEGHVGIGVGIKAVRFDTYRKLRTAWGL